MTIQTNGETTACRAQRLECVKAKIWGKLKKNIVAALKVTKSTVAFIILTMEKFGTTRTLPRAGYAAKQGNGPG